MIRVVVSNTSTLVSDDDLARWLPDLNTQIHRDFAPAWGIDAELVLGTAEAGDYSLILKDNPDDPNDLGFHFLDNNIPESRIFCRPTIDDGDTISSVMSHEAMEMLGDPTCQRMFGNYIAETADPVQSTGYMIGDTYVSNFVLPAYFDPSSAGPWDFNHQLTGPVPNMLSGGYIEWWTGQQWQQTFARREDGSIPYQMLKPNGRSRFRAAKGAPTVTA